MKLLRVFEHGASGQSGSKSYWTIKVEEHQTAAEVADIVASKCALLAGSFALFEVTVDGKNERRLQDTERPLDVLREWQASGDARKIFTVKKSTIVRFVDFDGAAATAETYVTMDLVDKAGQSKTAAQALEFIARKRLIAEPLFLLQVELSYTGRTLRGVAPGDSLMVVRRAWDATAATSFAFTRNPNAIDDDLRSRKGSQQLAIQKATAPLKAADPDERRRLKAVVEAECIDWIERVLGQRFADKTSLWAVLRERAGANLLALLNALQPNAIAPARYVAGTSDLALLKNLDLVRDALMRFGLDKRDVFEPVDVVEGHSNVLYTLFVLAFEAHRRGHAERWSTNATAGFFDRAQPSVRAADNAAAADARNAARLAARDAAARALRADIDMKPVYDAAIELNVPAVHAAIKLDDIDALHSLLLRDLERAELFANTCNERGQSPLHWAANLCRVRAVDALLLAGAKVDVTDANGATPLHLAAARHSAECVRALCAAGADALAMSSVGVTPLFAACDSVSDDPAPLEAMIAACAARGAPLDLDRACSDGQTCLHAAAREGRDRILRVLLAANASLRLRVAGGDTPLLLAAKVGAASTCELLLADGRRREAKQLDFVYSMLSDQDDDGNTALHAACGGNFVNVVRLLKKFDAPLDIANAANQTPTQLASDEGHLDLVALLGGAAEPSAPPQAPQPPPPPADDDDDDDEAPPPAPAPMAAESFAAPPPLPGPPAGAPPDGTGQDQRALFEAAKSGDAETVKQLLADGKVGVDAKDSNRNTALHLACRFGHASVIKQLLRNKVKLTSHNRAKETALHLAAQFNHAEAVRAVLKVLKPEKRAVLLDARCERFERTPLHYAMLHTTGADTSALDALLECEPLLLDPLDAHANTPLHLAAEAGNAEALARFLARAHVPPRPDAPALCNVDARNAAGDTPLHLAARSGAIGIVRRLVAVGADRNARNALGRTPLHVGVEADRDEVVAGLVVLRVDLAAVDAAGDTAAQLGNKLGHRYCASLAQV